MYPYSLLGALQSNVTGPLDFTNFTPTLPAVTFENIIRSSNTIFSTMVCPTCGKRLIFDEYSTNEFIAYCPNHNDYKLNITINGLVALLNGNGLNWLVTPAKRSECIKDSKKCEDVPPPDGLKFEPPEDNDG